MERREEGRPSADHARQRQIGIFLNASRPEAARTDKAIGTPPWTWANVETIPDLVELVKDEGLHTIQWSATTLHIRRATEPD